MQGLPGDTEDAPLLALFNGVPGVTGLRCVRDTATGACRGGAYLHFSAVEAATALLDSEWRDNAFFK